jgi:hypothetical protein
MTMPDTSVPAAVLAAVRSIPAQRTAPPPADAREPDGWQRCGAYEIREEPLHTEESER